MLTRWKGVKQSVWLSNHVTNSLIHFNFYSIHFCLSTCLLYKIIDQLIVNTVLIQERISAVRRSANI